MNKLWYIHEMDCFTEVKKEGTISIQYNIISNSHRHKAEQRKPEREQSILYGSIYMKFQIQRKVNLWRQKLEYWLPLVGGINGRRKEEPLKN